MRIGQGCTVHLARGELPMGRLIVSVSRHVVAVIDGVIHDTHDPLAPRWFALAGETAVARDRTVAAPISASATRRSRCERRCTACALLASDRRCTSSWLAPIRGRHWQCRWGRCWRYRYLLRKQ